MRNKLKDLEGVFSERKDDEVVFLDSSSIILQSNNENFIKNYKKRIEKVRSILKENPYWMIVPGVFREYHRGRNGLKNTVHIIKKKHHGEGPIKKSLFSKETLQARNRLLHVLRSQEHNALHSTNIDAFMYEAYQKMRKPVTDHFFKLHGEVHQVDVNLISAGLTYALYGRKVLMHSADVGLKKTFSGCAFALGDKLKHMPRITLGHYDAELIGSVSDNYLPK